MSEYEVMRDNVDGAQSLVLETEREMKHKLLVAKELYLRAIYELGYHTPIGARDEVISDLYWQCQDITVSDIAKAFGFPNGSAIKYIIQPHYDAKYSCPNCGIPIQINTRSHLATIKSGFHNACKRPYLGINLCHSCRIHRDSVQSQEQDLYIQARNMRLTELKSMPYQDYLETAEWKERRQRSLRSANYSCQLCNGANTELNVHHRTYERRGNENQRDLIVLCRDCHAKFHNKVGSEV